MGLKFKERMCAYALCDEVFPVSNERKIFCSDRCRGRHHALVNDEETEMIRLENNKIISNYRILQSLVVGQSYTFDDLWLLKYKTTICTEFRRDYENPRNGTFWCYDLGLKKEADKYTVVFKGGELPKL
jgi:hypothetical protein